MAWLCTKQWCIATMLIALVGTSRAEINLELNQAKIGTIAVKIKPDSASQQDKHVCDIVRIMKKDLGYSEKIAVVSDTNTADFLVRVKRSASIGKTRDLEQTFCMQIEYPSQRKERAGPQSLCLTGNPQTQLRQIAHQFSDKTHYHTTGKSNIFTHKIGYVKELPAQGREKTYQIAVSDFDRHNEQILLESNSPVMSLAFSPDGERLAYVSFEQDVSRIFIQNLMTGERHAARLAVAIRAACSQGL